MGVSVNLRLRYKGGKGKTEVEIKWRPVLNGGEDKIETSVKWRCG